MKCPRCGHWNRASFPRCFRCGCPLNQDASSGQEQEWLSEIEKNSGKEKTFMKVDEMGNAAPSPDFRDSLAAEMQDLHARKERGEEKQRALRLDDTNADYSIATGRRAHSTTRQHVIFSDEQGGEAASSRRVESAYDSLGESEPSGDVAYRAMRATPNRSSASARSMTTRTMRTTHAFGIRRLTRVGVILLIVLAVAALGVFGVYKLGLIGQETLSFQDQVLISASIYDDLPAHIIQIPAEDGTEIYIKELHVWSEPAIGGYVTFEIPDYEWYENETNLEDEVYHVTMTPYQRMSNNEQKRLGTITFDVQVPLSPLTLISPDVTYLEVNSFQTYQIQFQVEKGSEVTINGENYSDLVSSTDGLLSYNATIQPIGENYITIECKTKYYRKNTVVLTLYRQVQDIKLELDSTLSTEYRGAVSEMTISGTTLNKATIRVLSPYRDLNTDKLLTDGTFSFVAIFDKIGNNTITIEASYPGRETTTVNFVVYHVPSATNYTKKAWPMDADNYTEFLDNITYRVKTTQIYVCKGTITKIISTSPVLAIMETGTADASREVLLENKSTDTWEVGDVLRVYGDAFGSYDGKPWLVGRYTYSN